MTEQAWSIKDLLYGQKGNFFSWNWNNQTWATSFCSGSQSERRIHFILPAGRSGHCNKLTFRYSSNLWHWQANTIRAFHLKVMSGLTWFPFSARNAIQDTVTVIEHDKAFIQSGTGYRVQNQIIFSPQSISLWIIFFSEGLWLRVLTVVGVFHGGPSHV